MATKPDPAPENHEAPRVERPAPRHGVAETAFQGPPDRSSGTHTPEHSDSTDPRDVAAREKRSMTPEEMHAAIYLLQLEVLDLRNERSQKIMQDLLPKGPSALEDSQRYARDDAATSGLTPDYVAALAKASKRPEHDGLDLKPEDIMSASVRGPYVVASLHDNGMKVAFDHDLSVEPEPRVSSKTALKSN